MKKKSWKKKYKALYTKYIMLEQVSLAYCKECGWNGIIPDGICLICKHFDCEEKKQKQSP